MIRPPTVATIRRAGLADVAAIARVYVEAWRTAYAGLVPDDVLVRMSPRQQEESWAGLLRRRQRAPSVVVADVSRVGVVGVGSFGRMRDCDLPYDGEIYTLYVHPDFQGERLGKRLLRTMFGLLVERGHGSGMVWVLAANPSRFFYEAMGGVRVATRTERLWGTKLPELAYGWSDLRVSYRSLTERG